MGATGVAGHHATHRGGVPVRPGMKDFQRIYIVEDDASTRKALLRWARLGGYDACAFATATEFLGSALATEGAGLILDLGLPDLEGAEVKRRLVAEGRDLPTVFVSGFTEGEIARSLAGFDHPTVLRKPFDHASLSAALASLG